FRALRVGRRRGGLPAHRTAGSGFPEYASLCLGPDRRARRREICGTEAPQSADIILVIDGEEHSITQKGDGPVDAAFNCIKALVSHEARLDLYQVHAVTEGTDAQATVSVRLSEAGKLVTAQSSDTDTVVASARAYVHALNKLLVRREKSAPETLAV
ncbi:MAG: alpha-isopropylmalate synthase regulatory domain-containing protein, partial [Pseudomonadota bacterium]